MQNTDRKKDIKIKKYILGVLIVTLTILTTIITLMYVLKSKEEQQSKATQILDPSKQEAANISKETATENQNTTQTDTRVLIQPLQERIASDEERIMQIEEEIKALKEIIKKQEIASALFMDNVQKTDTFIETINRVISESQKILRSLVLGHGESITKLNNLVFRATGVSSIQNQPGKRMSVFKDSPEEEEQP
ncbi:hypothetical protein NEIG_02592 [Nematocida sp. ERTm5]|nr:hypothetical protein NEIG_01401 [Nematocida sp. ERTm5]OAG32714.1 hypothetical protein NEIG_02547 [Nematocida sp. ERTm5]OAG32720.1 hypothetical protein NEIG_02609 [Nematocida sp. ERTm5]OAG32725.1 hypothetical protein NEIG_02592 [Nematocida sp. ERTm5]